MGCWASTESEIRLILIYLMTHQVRIFIVAHLHSRLLTLFLIATWGIISTLLDQSYYFLGILRMSTKPRGFNQRVMLWRRMDYCFHIPPPTIHHRPFGYTNKWNKQDLTVCCVNVYWLWSSDEEHKLNTIRPLGLSLSPSVLSPADTCYNQSAHQEYFSLRSEVWDVPRLESSQDKHWQQITTPGCSEDPVALSVITTLIKGCCELNSNGYKISVLTFLQFFTDFAKQLLTSKFAQTRSNWLFQSAIKNILMPERNDFILSSRNIWEIFPGGFEEISSYYLNQKKLM